MIFSSFCPAMEDNEELTVGAHSRNLQLQEDEKICAIDLQRAIHKGIDSEKSFEHQLLTAIERGRKALDGPFYVVVLFKKERIMTNVVRQYFFYRISCPTPEYDQTVYHFDPKTEELRYLWSVPDKSSTHQLYLMKHELPPEYQKLGEFCKQFIDGDLDRRCAFLNGEKWEG